MKASTMSLLVPPGGRGTLDRNGDALVSDDGRRFPIEGGIVRMLEAVDPGLAAELKAQEAALAIYLNDRFLLTRYERTLARVAVEDLLGTVSGPVLDAGCGIGMIGRFYPGMDLYGVDASFPLLQQARTGYSLLVESRLEKLPFEDGVFEAILGLNVLHHVADPARAVAELARVLRPGGAFVALDPRKVGVIELAKRILRKGDKAYTAEHKAFSVREYATIVGGGGAFRVQELRRFGFLALVGAGGLDQLGISTRLPSPGLVLGGLTAVDRLLERLPGLQRSGLYHAARAERVAARSTRTPAAGGAAEPSAVVGR